MGNDDIAIVKVGSNTLIDEGGAPRVGVIKDILESIAYELRAGRKILLVTSGAVKLGRVLGNGAELTRSVAAGIGQPALFRYFEEEARRVGVVLAEFLLSRPYLIRREQFLNFQKTIQDLFQKGVIPVVNENDALVAGTDWSFGDNDSLASALAITLNARHLIILSHIEGLYDSDPTNNPGAKLIEEVDNLSDDFLHYCSNGASQGGMGGMLSKLKVARSCTAIGVEVQIINGIKIGNLRAALEGKRIGTVFKGRDVREKVSNRDRWILAAKSSWGSIEIDDGAAEALRQGKSLLAVGVCRAYGQFDSKEVIEIVDRNTHGVAYGIVDFSRHEIEQMLMAKEVHKKMLIHANNIFVIR